MELVYSDRYNIDIGEHPWSPRKYEETLRMLREMTPESTWSISNAPMAEDEDILRVHSFEFWRKLNDIDFMEEEERILELPITAGLIDLFWRMAGGTALATETALKEGLCVHIGGGFHHAYPDYGAGFCLINDIAVSVRSVQEKGLAERIAIIDCDVHQGDGTAWIFKDEPNVITFSIHQLRNFPRIKRSSSIDIDMEDATGDAHYLAMLRDGLGQVAAYGPFDLVHYQAGADPYSKDTLGGLALTTEGLQRRDSMVLDWAATQNAPAIVTLGGGYTETIQDVARIHANTILAAVKASKQFVGHQ
ncbi:MAG: histone deacetylase [Verrucomicrobiota bacterium]